jgi:hypothetical protein
MNIIPLSLAHYGAGYYKHVGRVGLGGDAKKFKKLYVCARVGTILIVAFWSDMKLSTHPTTLHLAMF